MIAVIGNPYLRRTDGGDVVASGLAADIARVAASRGARVELIGRTGDDPAGDDLLTALSRAGVGHVALLRDAAIQVPELSDDGSIRGPVPVLEPADIDLALRYLTDFRVLVLAEPAAPGLRAGAAAAAGWNDATLIVLVAAGTPDDPSLPDGVLVIETGTRTDGADDEDPVPGADATGGLAALVGALAARIDAGEPAGSAFRVVSAEIGATPAVD